MAPTGKMKPICGPHAEDARLELAEHRRVAAIAARFPSELPRLTRWTGPIMSQVVRIVSIEQILPQNKTPPKNIN
jgi:hypothetical protein